MRTRTLEIGICMAANVGEGGGGVRVLFIYYFLFIIIVVFFTVVK